MEKKPWLFSYYSSIIEYTREEPIFTHDGDFFDFIETWLHYMPHKHYEVLWWWYYGLYQNIIEMKRGWEKEVKFRCINGHDRCYGGYSASEECPYCERYTDE